MDYKEQIEKEAKSNADLFYQENRDVKFSNYEYGFHDGVNSKISERIKVEYAIDILNKLSVDNGTVGFIENKITELKQQINGK